jgi:excisionase family DNA binding protein
MKTSIMFDPNELKKGEKTGETSVYRRIYMSGKNQTPHECLIQAVEYLNLAKATLYKFTACREIRHFKKGKKLYFKKSELDEWILESRIKTRKEIETEATNYLLKRPFKGKQFK